MANREKYSELLAQKKHLLDFLAGEFISDFPAPNNTTPSGIELMKAGAIENAKILGKWEIIEHTVNDEPFLSYFQKTTLKSMELIEPVFEASYYFKGRICLKSLRITGNISLEGKILPYSYTVKLTMTYQIKQPGNLTVFLESGYLYYTLGEKKPVIKDFQANGEALEINFHLDAGNLILEESKENDKKILRRISD